MEPLIIAGHKISEGGMPLIIAEIGNNHDGRLEQALELIAAADEAGADAVKFQTYDPARLVTPKHELHGFFSRFALPRSWHRELKAAAEARGLVFLSTPFDADAADFLVSLGVPALKIASSDLTNQTLLRHCAACGLPLIISSGMADFREIEEAVGLVREAGCQQIALMHCVSLYPTPPEKSNLLVIPTLKQSLDVVVGFSDHSLSTSLPAAAVALGARVIEKHFTISRALPGPDHAVALEPDEFARMALGCRETAAALGVGEKTITVELQDVRRASLRGLYAAVDIPAGARLRMGMLSLLRPVGEFSIADLPRVLGRRVAVDIAAGRELKSVHFEKAAE